MPELTPAEKTLRASLAANVRWANEDRAVASERQRRLLTKRFEDEVDPDRSLPPRERALRAENAMRAHMRRMSFQALRARRERAQK